MAVLEMEYAIFNQMKEELEENHHMEWVVIHGDEVMGTHKTFQKAAEAAVIRYGRGPYLITQIGSPPLTLPASVQYRRHI